MTHRDPDLTHPTPNAELAYKVLDHFDAYPTDEMLGAAERAFGGNAEGDMIGALKAALAIVKRGYKVYRALCGDPCPEDPEESCELVRGHDSPHWVDVIKKVTW